MWQQEEAKRCLWCEYVCDMDMWVLSVCTSYGDVRFVMNMYVIWMCEYYEYVCDIDMWVLWICIWYGYVRVMIMYVIQICTWNRCGSKSIQGGEDSQDPLSCRSFSTKEPLNIGLFCGKWPRQIRDPMSLRHPVLQCALQLTPLDYVSQIHVCVDVLDIN